MPDVHIVVLAAGKGTRMKSARPKVLHRVAGTPMIDYVLSAASSLQPTTITIVVGHQAKLFAPAYAGGRFTVVVQEPQLGTAHALLAVEPALERQNGTLVLLSGDVPLLTPQTLRHLLDRQTSSQAAATVLTAVVERPYGYGRIVRSGGQIARVVEERDASAVEREIREINSGIYAFALGGLFDALRAIPAENAQGEHYLPDLITMYRQRGLRVETLAVDPDEIRGINNRAELAEVSGILRRRKNNELMDAGVTVEDPVTTYVDADVQVGPDTIIHPGVSIEEGTTIGAGCEIHSGVRIVASRIGDRVTIRNHSVITGALIEDDAAVGPFAHLRPNTVLRTRARVGSFVEVKKTTLGPGSKSMHLTYLGDTTVGANVNIGAGTITCNYDGVAKRETVIEDDAFIGSDSQLVAPVTIGKGAYVGSGATIREDVPPGALAVSAGKQRNLAGWAEERKKKTEG